MRTKLKYLIESVVSEARREYWGRQGAGIIPYCGHEILLGLRSGEVLEPNTWSYPGGRIEPEEDPKGAAIRELREETNYRGPIKNIKMLRKFHDEENDFTYFTFIAEVPEKFEADTDWENNEFRWFSIDRLPRPMHFGLKNVLSSLRAFMTNS